MSHDWPVCGAVLGLTFQFIEQFAEAALGHLVPATAFHVSVVEEADCLMLLDVNNLYVNSRASGHDARACLDAISRESSLVPGPAPPWPLRTGVWPRRGESAKD